MNSAFDIATGLDEQWKINGRAAEEEVRQYLFQNNIAQLDGVPDKHCPYCSHELKRKAHRQYDGEDNQYVSLKDEPYGEVLTRNYVLNTCSYCSYWFMTGREEAPDCMDFTEFLSATSVTAKFNVSTPHGCSEELAQHLRRKPELWHRLDPHRLETLVADIFKANHQHCEVKHVGRPGDLGVDILFIDDNNTKHLIQVKRREHPNRAEGFSTLQSILGTMALHGDRYGIIVSTADYFSYQAKKQTKNAAQQGYYVELIDKGVLTRMVGPLLPQTAWKDLFSHPDAKVIADLKTNFTKFNQDTVAIGNVRDSDVEALNDLTVKPKFVDPNQLNLFDF